MGDITSVLRWAEKEVGYLEKASNDQLDDKTANAGKGNFTKYWRDLEPSFQGQAWCNCFVNWCFYKSFNEGVAKSMLYTKGDWSFYTPTSASYFKDNGRWFTSPQVGDIIYFKNSTRIHHVGIVYKVSSSLVYTIEGNTNEGSQVIPNGGAVCKKQYELKNKNIAGYGRPKYRDVDESTVIIDAAASSDRKGLLILADKLNIRKTPIDGEVVGTLKKGQRIAIIGKAKASDDSVWFKTRQGYISGKYVEGWIKESNNLWWYVLEGYNYPLNCIYTIDNNDYIFDKEGWMVTNDRIDSSGKLKQI